MRNAYATFIETPEGKRPLETSRSRWEGNIRTILKEINWEIVDWINLAQDRDHWRTLVNTVMNIWVL
jgi:hypothetical protein